MPIYRTLEPVAYLDGSRVISVNANRLIELTDDQAELLGDSIDYVSSGTKLPAHISIVAFDSVNLFPADGVFTHLYLAQDTGRLYQWLESTKEYALVSIEEPGSGDVSTNTSSSVDGEIVLFSGTTGKILKRATTTGVLKAQSGVIGTATTDDILPTQTGQSGKVLATNGTTASWTATNSYTPGGTDVALADGGTGTSLTDPNVDRIMFWDDSAGAVTWLAPGTNLSISGTTLNATGAGIGDVSTNTSTSVVGEVLVFADTSGKLAQRATGSGVAKLTSGVMSTATQGADYYAPGGTDVAIVDGGTGASTASNARANLSGFTTTATAAGTTTLDVTATQVQVFTGSTTQTVKLPTTSVPQGGQYIIINQSTGAVTVQSSGANTITILAAGTSATFTAVVATPTTAANWSSRYLGVVVASGKALTVSNSVTLAGTDGTTITLPSTTSTVVAQGGALGTPSSGTLTNCTGLPAAGLVASTSTSVGFGSIELGHATDTTISRGSAGVAAVEGSPIVTDARLATSDVPRFLTFSSGWPTRPDDDRLTFFVGGDTATDAPTDANLRTNDIWIPAS